MALKLTSSILPTAFAFSFPSVCRSPWRLQGSCRTLFSSEALGIDQYARQRKRTESQFQGMQDRFRSKMLEYSLTDDTKNMIFTEDLKNMVHLVEAKPEDLTLVRQMMQKFNQQNKSLRFGSFIFGPVIMRMYYHLNEPTEALEVFKDPKLDGLFDQMVSHQILCDLLYQNNRYDDVLEVFEITKEKKINGSKFPRNCTTLAMASCYKLNTKESYELALKMLTDLKEVGAEPVRRTVTFAAALALAQNSPQVALEILTLSRTSNYVTVRNLKISCLIDLNRVDDALPILRQSIENDHPDPDRKITVCPDVLEQISMAIDNLGNKEVSLEFERIHKALNETKQISSETLTELLVQEIEKGNALQAGQRDIRRQPQEDSFRPGRAMSSFRPQQNPGYNRERQSSRYQY